MEVNELMIGDWALSTKNNRTYQIDSIIMYGIQGAILRGDTSINNHFEPIPLTDNILKINGFKCRQTYACPRYSWIDDKGHKLISFLRDRDGYEMQVGGQRVRLLYVHQLQHALRLCRLNMLADNFILELKEGDSDDND